MTKALLLLQRKRKNNITLVKEGETDEKGKVNKDNRHDQCKIVPVPVCNKSISKVVADHLKYDRAHEEA